MKPVIQQYGNEFYILGNINVLWDYESKEWVDITNHSPDPDIYWALMDRDQAEKELLVCHQN